MKDAASLAEAVQRAMAVHGARPVLRDDEGELTLTQLDARANAVALALAERGVGPGTRVLLQLPNTREAWAAFMAVWKRGATAVATGASTADELAPLLARVRPAVHIIDASRRAVTREAYRRTELKPVLMTDRDDDEGGALALNRLSSIDSAPQISVSPDDPASIVFSSGTTGPSKGIVHTHRSLLDVTAKLTDILRLNASDVVFSVNPLYHVWSQVSVLLSGLLRGACTVLGSFRYPRSLRMLALHRITVMHAPPPLVSALAHSRILDHDLASLRTIVTGGAPVNISAIERLRELLPHVQLRQGYGTSEFCLACFDDESAPPTPPGKAGRLVPRCEVRILSPQGQERTSGDEGEIVVRSSSMMSGYLDEPEATAAVLRDGWFYTGDLGSIDGEGYLEVTGRLKDIIIVNGQNVAPVEVEQAIHRYPGVLKASVVGIPHPASGEAVKAFIVPEDGAEIDVVALLGFLRARLSRGKIPRSIELVDELPESATGKVRHELLRAQTRGDG